MRLKGIKVVTKADGTRYVYRRVGSSLVRLPDLPENDPAFLRAYEAAGAAPAPKPVRAAAGTVKALTIAYMASDEWGDLAPGTRRVVRGILLKIAEARGDAPVHGLRRRHIEADLAGLTAAVANNRRKAWLALCRFAAASSAFTIEGNPAAEVPRRKVKTDGFLPWPVEHKDRFRRFWAPDTPPRLAFELFSWVGARCCDTRRLGRQMVDRDGWISFTQQKTGVAVAVPFTCALPEWAEPLAAEQERLLEALAAHKGDMTFILTEAGAPRSEKAISQWFSEKAAAAGIPAGFTAHGLRKSRGIALAEIEATTHQIMSWLGHLSLDEAELYTKAANRRRVLAGTERNRKAGNRDEAVSKTGEKH